MTAEKRLRQFINNLSESGTNEVKILCGDNNFSLFKEDLETVLNQNKQLQEKLDKINEYCNHFNAGEVCENVTIIAKIIQKIINGEEV